MDPAQFDLVFEVMPTQEHTHAERRAALELLGRGGRFVLVGEHNDFANTENKLITKLISSLGGALIVRETVMTNNDFSSSDRSIAAHAITAGQKHRRLQNGIPSIECELSPGPVVSGIALLKEDASWTPSAPSTSR